MLHEREAAALFYEAVKYAAARAVNSVAPRRASLTRNSLSARKIQQSGSDPVPSP